MTIRIMQGDCRELMKTLDADSVDSIVCDPPYELTSGKKGGSGVASANPNSPAGRSRIGTGEGSGGFMGLKWDSTGVALDPATWREALRVLKPGGHLVAFGGTRTFHRLACAIEDAGFELRDGIGYAHEAETISVTIPVNECPWLLAWAYGSGFPKSLDVSKEIDRQLGAVRTEVVGVKPGHEDFVARTDAFAAGGRADGWDRPWKADPGAIADSHMVKAPVTDEARHWQGWGTALKPAWEPIVLARKPLARGRTVAGNVVAHGTGALNIDGSRVSADDGRPARDARVVQNDSVNGIYGDGLNGSRAVGETTLGRWPANVITDGSDEVLAAFPDAPGQKAQVTGDEPSQSTGNVYNPWRRTAAAPREGDGSAARFFYTSKASARDRHEGLECACNNKTWGSADRKANTRAATDTQRARATTASTTREDSGWPTSSSGSGTTAGLFPTDSRSITETTTSSTTTPTTSNSSTPSRTSESTPDASCEMASGGSPAATAPSSSLLTPSIGISAPKDGPNTADAADATSASSSPTKVRDGHCPTCGRRNRSTHPTVKPTDLMRYLVRLVTRPGGTVLDIFAGSGSTLKAAELEGFSAIGMELDEGYCEIARERVSGDAPLFREVHSA